MSSCEGWRRKRKYLSFARLQLEQQEQLEYYITAYKRVNCQVLSFAILSQESICVFVSKKPFWRICFKNLPLPCIWSILTLIKSTAVRINFKRLEFETSRNIAMGWFCCHVCYKDFSALDFACHLEIVHKLNDEEIKAQFENPKAIACQECPRSYLTKSAFTSKSNNGWMDGLLRHVSRAGST